MNGDTKMPSNAYNAGSKFLRGEGVRSLDRSPPTEWIFHTVGGIVWVK